MKTREPLLGGSIDLNFADVHTSGLAASLAQIDALQQYLTAAQALGLRQDTPTVAIKIIHAMVEDLMDTQSKRGLTIKQCIPQLQIIRVALIFSTERRTFATGHELYNAIRDYLKDEAQSVLSPEQYQEHINAYERLNNVIKNHPAGSA